MSPLRQAISRESRQTLFMGMESAWFAATLLMMDGIQEKSGLTGLVWLCINNFPAYILARVVLKTTRRRIIRLSGLVLCGLVCVGAEVWLMAAASLSGPFSVQLAEVFGAPERWKYGLAVVICGGFIWARGMFMAGRKVDTDGMIGGFQVGLCIMIISIFLAALGHLNHTGFPAALGCFFAIGLSGIAWSRRLDSVDRSRNAVSGSWVWAMPVSVILVLAVGILGFLFLDRNLLQFILQPVFMLWDALLRVIHFLLSLLPDPGPMNPLEMPSPPPPPPGDGLKNIRDYFAWLRPIGNVMFAGGSLALVLGALFRVLADVLRFLRKRFNPLESVMVERMHYGAWDDLKLVFMELILLPVRLFRLAARLLHFGSKPLNDFQRIKTVYLEFLKWGARVGSPKARGETPGEYAFRFSSMLNEDGYLRLRAFTDAFMRFRYSPDAPVSEDVSNMKTDLRAVKKGLLKKKDRPAPTSGLILSKNQS